MLLCFGTMPLCCYSLMPCCYALIPCCHRLSCCVAGALEWAQVMSPRSPQTKLLSHPIRHSPRELVRASNPHWHSPDLRSSSQQIGGLGHQRPAAATILSPQVAVSQPATPQLQGSNLLATPQQPQQQQLCVDELREGVQEGCEGLTEEQLKDLVVRRLQHWSR